MTTVDELLVKLFHAPKVLVVDDAAGVLANILRQDYGCSVDTTDNGHEAIKMLTDGNYEFAVVDLELLNGTGEAVLETAHMKCPATPIVVTTAHTDVIALLQRLDTLVLLRKPITHEALDRLFYIFKIKVRSPAVVEYLTAMRPTVATGSVG
jgi:CheY-like chemotaxis protein